MKTTSALIKNGLTMRKPLNRYLFLLLLIPLSVSGGGLGKIRIKSALGEPLSAEIELTENSAEETSPLTARMASPEEYATAGMPDVNIPAGIHVRVVRHADNSRVLELSSDRPINEPFVDLLIKAESPTVNLLRQYTLLLDPPTSRFGDETDTSSKPDNKAKTQGVTASAASAEMESGTELEYVPGKVHKSARHAKKTPAVAAVITEPKKATASIDVEAESYTTQPGDVFGKVAQRYQPEGVSLKRVMAAFLAANPDAFIDSDINQLKAAQVLRIPTQESIKGLPPKAANEQSKSAPVAIKDQSNATAKPEVSPKFVLKISPGDTESNVSSDTHPAGVPTINKSPNNNADGAISTKTEPAPVADVNSPVANSTLPLPSSSSVRSTVAPGKTVTKPATAQSGSDNSSFGNSLVAHLPWIALGMAISLLFIIILFVVNKRRFAAMQNWQNGIFGEDQTPLQIDSRTNPEDAFPVTSVLSSVLSENSELYSSDTISNTSFLQETGMDFHEIDPLVEAEIYMSYGRDEQAENILISALSKTPHKHELSLGLLKIYSDRKDLASFERIAQKVYAAAEHGGAENAVIWGKAAIKGSKLDPDNPLYQIEGFAQEPTNADQIESDEIQDDVAPELPVETLGFPALEDLEQPALDQSANLPLDTLQELGEPLAPIQFDEEEKPAGKSNILEFSIDENSKISADKKKHTAVNQKAVN